MRLFLTELKLQDRGKWSTGEDSSLNLKSGRQFSLLQAEHLFLLKILVSQLELENETVFGEIKSSRQRKMECWRGFLIEFRVRSLIFITILQAEHLFLQSIFSNLSQKMRLFLTKLKLQDRAKQSAGEDFSSNFESGHQFSLLYSKQKSHFLAVFQFLLLFLNWSRHCAREKALNGDNMYFKTISHASAKSTQRKQVFQLEF